MNYSLDQFSPWVPPADPVFMFGLSNPSLPPHASLMDAAIGGAEG